MARALYNDHAHSVTDICKTLGISRATPYRALEISAAPDMQLTDR